MRTEVHYEICTEDDQGFNPTGISFATIQEAQAELPRYRKRWGQVFIVRIVLTKVDGDKPAKLMLV